MTQPRCPLAPGGRPALVARSARARAPGRRDAHHRERDGGREGEFHDVPALLVSRADHGEEGDCEQDRHQLEQGSGSRFRRWRAEQTQREQPEAGQIPAQLVEQRKPDARIVCGSPANWLAPRALPPWRANRAPVALVSGPIIPPSSGAGRRSTGSARRARAGGRDVAGVANRDHRPRWRAREQSQETPVLATDNVRRASPIIASPRAPRATASGDPRSSSTLSTRNANRISGRRASRILGGSCSRTEGFTSRRVAVDPIRSPGLDGRSKEGQPGKSSVSTHQHAEGSRRAGRRGTAQQPERVGGVLATRRGR